MTFYQEIQVRLLSVVLIFIDMKIDLQTLYYGGDLKSYEIYEILIGKKEIETTPTHEFYAIDKGWVKA